MPADPSPTPGVHRSRRKRWSSRSGRAALCLLLGAVTTVGVAWGLVWDRRYDIGVPDVTISYILNGQWCNVTIRDRAGVRMVLAVVAPTQDPRSLRHEEGDLDDSLRAAAAQTWTMMPIEDFRQTPLYRRLPLREHFRFPSGGQVQISSVYAAGWPAPALWHAIDHHSLNNSSNSTWRGSIQRPWSQWVGDRLPIAPLFPGFLLDTLFYAVPWWILLVTPGTVKRWWVAGRRRRRGLCIACGYDLRGLDGGAVCPECGG